MKLQRPPAESLALFIDSAAFHRLRAAAAEHGLTISWMIRKILVVYLHHHPLILQLKRVRRPAKGRLRFNLYFWGDKSAFMARCRAFNHDAGEVVRQAVDAFLAGELEVGREVDLRIARLRQPPNAAFSETSYHKLWRRQKGSVDTLRLLAPMWRQDSYWPYSPARCLALLARSYRRRPEGEAR